MTRREARRGARLGPILILLPVAFFAACSGPATLPPPPEPAVRPNVVIVVFDTARADFFSSYGYERETTPTVDRIAAEGARFTRAYSTSFWTLPSHASLFTGLFPGESGATSETNFLPDSASTLAELLSEEGYRSVAATSNPWITVERGFAQGFETFVEAWRAKTPSSPPETVAVERAEGWIRERADDGRPLFLFVNLNTPHLPYIPPQGLFREFIGGTWANRDLVRVMQIQGMWSFMTGNLALGAADFEMLRALYAAEMRLTDEYLSRIVALLRESGMLDETLLVVTSDHGENIGDHGRIDHLLSMYDTTVRVPLVLRYPARIEAGAVRDDLASLVDIAPTVLDVAGFGASGGRERIERTSLLGSDRIPRSFVVAENDRPVNALKLLKEQFPRYDRAPIDRTMRMVRTERHKLIWHGDGETLLFDLEADPAETRDLSETRPEVVEQLMDHLRAWTARTATDDRPQPFTSQDDASLERLRSLGYIQ